jgi:hypothetical protein
MDPTTSERESDDDENDDILFSCRCESARVINMLLACLQHVSPSSSFTHGQSNAGMTQNVDRPRRGQDKAQYATVIVSENAVSFYVYGFGKQSQAMVDLHAGLFTEFYVSEIQVPADEICANPSPSSPGDMRTIYGGDFGINLTTVLNCLNVLGTTALDRTKICFTYDRRMAIFKIELLEEGLNGNGSNNMGGSILSTCAIPGMCAPEEEGDDADGTLTQGRTALTVAYRSSPIVARAVLKSDFLGVVMNELNDVPGAVSATLSLSPTGIELSTIGHTTECHISLPYQGNHPQFFLNLECKPQKMHSQSYPLHSVLTAMKGLDIGQETCISMNAIGMIAIQHQIVDPITNKEPCYVDFIMGCLEDELDLADNDDDHRNMNHQRFDYSQSERSIVDKDKQSHQDLRENKNKRNIDDSDCSCTEEEEDTYRESQRSPSKGLFGAVAEFGKGDTTKGQKRIGRRAKRSSTTHEDFENEGNKGETESLEDGHFLQEDSQGDVEVSFFDVVSRQSGRRSCHVPTSPRLMYGETRLEESDDDEEL